MARSAAQIRANGDRLVRERRARNLTQLQAAVAIGISPQTLRAAENSESVQPKTLDQIAAFYNVDVDKIGRAS